MSLQLTRSMYNEIIEHAQSIAPIESCGYLAGKNGVAEVFYKMTNVDQSPEHFSFDPKEQFQVVKDARQKGLSLIAVYHSHPETPARLSDEDIRLFNDPDPVYIIVSLKDEVPDMKGYHVRKPSSDEVEIVRVEITLN